MIDLKNMTVSEALQQLEAKIDSIIDKLEQVEDRVCDIEEEFIEDQLPG